jgi:thioesterase domain-containing protein
VSEPENIPIKDLNIEEGSQEMLKSPSMEPYMQLALKVVKEEDPDAALEEIAKLRLENRYVWRIASALKWAFCDFDDLNVEADRATLEEADLEKVTELIRLRPAQFCLFLKALLGEQEMEQVMLEALAMAKQH